MAVSNHGVGARAAELVNVEPATAAPPRRDPSRADYIRERLQLRSEQDAEKQRMKSVLAGDLVLARTALDGNMTTTVFAAALSLAGVPTRQQLVSDWENPRMPAAPTSLHIEAAHRAGFHRWAAAASRIEQRGLHLVPSPAVIDEPEHARTSRVTQEVLEAVNALQASMKDGHRDAGDAAREIREWEDVLAVATEQIAKCRQVQAAARAGR